VVGLIHFSCGHHDTARRSFAEAAAPSSLPAFIEYARKLQEKLELSSQGNSQTK
jgi:hypothetical protein